MGKRTPSQLVYCTSSLSEAVWYYHSMILICISLRIMKLDTFYYTKWLLSIFFGEIHIQMLFLNYLVSPFWLIFRSYYLT